MAYLEFQRGVGGGGGAQGQASYEKWGGGGGRLLRKQRKIFRLLEQRNYKCDANDLLSAILNFSFLTLVEEIQGQLKDLREELDDWNKSGSSWQCMEIAAEGGTFYSIDVQQANNAEN